MFEKCSFFYKIPASSDQPPRQNSRNIRQLAGREVSRASQKCPVPFIRKVPVDRFVDIINFPDHRETPKINTIFFDEKSWKYFGRRKCSISKLLRLDSFETLE